MTNRIVPFLLLATLTWAAGCNGPTAEGIKNREAARGRIDGVNAHLTYEQAEQSFEVGNFDRAQKYILKALARMPDEPKYHVLQGRIFLEKSLLEEALRSFGTAIDLDAEMDEAHYYSGVVFQRWSDDERAYDHYLKSSELDETNVHYLLAAAEMLVVLDRPAEAKSIIEPRLEYFEHNAALWHLLAQIAVLEGDLPEAVRLYQEARMLRSDDVGLLEELTLTQFEAEMYGPCLESISQLKHQLDDDRTDFLHLEAKCLAYLDRTLEARDMLLDLTRSQPSDPDVWIELGTLAWRLGDWRRVAESSVRVIAIAPNRFEGYMLKGINERQHDRLEAAANLFRQATERTDDEVMPRVLLGLTLAQLGEHESARQAFEGALAIDPTHAEARMLLDHLNRGGSFSFAGASDEGGALH